MTTPEIEAAERHLIEVRGLGESPQVIERAEQRLRDAKGEAQTEPAQPEVQQETSTALADLNLSERIVEALAGNAEILEEPRLVSPDGLREWIAEGNDLVDLIDIGRVSATEIKEALGIR